MADRAGRALSVAAVQVRSENGKIAENLRRAEPLLERAASQGAGLILLPEFLAAGYVFSEEIWDGGEPREGPTARWLRAQSRRLGVYLGSSFLEAEGEDFFNTFVLTTPDGAEAGRVRKQTPALFEAFFTRGGAGTHVIHAEVGRIGVGICYENQLAYTPRLMCAQAVDLMLMPHAAPVPDAGLSVPQKARTLFEESLKRLPVVYASRLGIPVVFCNKSGPWRSPLPGLPCFPQTGAFPGLSSVVDAGGSLKSRLGPEEGVALAEVRLDRPASAGAWGRTHGRWAMDVPPVANLCRLVELRGRLSYRLNARRKRRAREIARGHA